MNRTITLVSKEVGDLLVAQIGHELQNHAIYQAFANYFSRLGIVDLEKYYRHRAHEEYNHHMWCYDYLNDADYPVDYPTVEHLAVKIENDVTPFTFTVTREIETTQKLYNIYNKAIEQKDFMTASWLYDKLIKEQIEEENISRMAESIMETESSLLIKGEAILELLD